MPAGEREYLSRLVCGSGEQPQFRRVGSMGSRTAIPEKLSEAEERDFIKEMMRVTPLEPSDADYHVIDGYEVICGGVRHLLHFDMYHCGQPASSTPPTGFTLRSQ